MNTEQIRRALLRGKYTKPAFLDVYASDQLPSQITSFPACFVANVDTSKQAGTHWVAFYLPSENELEFFDSFGHAPQFFKGPIADFASRFSHVSHNPMTLQSNVTGVCGHYCIYFLYSRCRGKSLRKCISSFVARHLTNDKKVYDFVRHVFKIKTRFFL